MVFFSLLRSSVSSQEGKKKWKFHLFLKKWLCPLLDSGVFYMPLSFYSQKKKNKIAFTSKKNSRVFSIVYIIFYIERIAILLSFFLSLFLYWYRYILFGKVSIRIREKRHCRYTLFIRQYIYMLQHHEHMPSTRIGSNNVSFVTTSKVWSIYIVKIVSIHEP